MWALPWWCYPVLALLAAGRLHTLGILMHDCSHMPMRRKDLSIHALEMLCAYPITTTMNAMRYHHLRHHRDSGMRTDPYFKAGLEGRPLVHALNVLRGALLIPFWTLRVPVGLVAVVWQRARNLYGRVWLRDYVRAHDRSLATLLATTRDHHLVWPKKLVLAPRNVGDHVAHHLHLQIGLEHLPALRAWYVEHFPERYPH